MTSSESPFNDDQKKSHKSVIQWSEEDVAAWLEKTGFQEATIELLCKKHKLDGRSLLTLNEDDLRKKPLSLPCLGDIKRLGIAIRNLQHTNQTLVYELVGSGFTNNAAKLRHGFASSRNRTPENTLQESSSGLDESSEGDHLEDVDPRFEYPHLIPQTYHRRELKPETWKAVIAMLYFFTVTWITSFVMVIVHDRVPDMQTYPPLPDLFLDNVPHIPWAFTMCEVCGLTLFIVWCVVLTFHKHRFILLRRMFSLFGTVFLLRCFTMLITSLSVPGRHLECKARPYGSWKERFVQAYLIWQGGGMTLQGVRTCGDYMFSGHTCVLTLLNFFITEYTPAEYYFVHTFSWVLNLFGIFFILAGHEHYSIDVFIAFYISTRLFLYYHTLANNRAIHQADSKRTRIWFPLFYFFESGVDGPVPNEFEMPFSYKRLVRFIKQKLIKQHAD